MLDWGGADSFDGLREGRPRLVRAVHPARRQRDHAQRDLARHARADRASPSSASCCARSPSSCRAPSTRSCAGRARCACCAAWRCATPSCAGRSCARATRCCCSTRSANRDEEVFADPFAFRVDRSPNEHLTFGLGPHYCLGANLARMEIETVIGALLERLPDLRLAPGARVREARNPILVGDRGDAGRVHAARARACAIAAASRLASGCAPISARRARRRRPLQRDVVRRPRRVHDVRGRRPVRAARDRAARREVAPIARAREVAVEQLDTGIAGRNREMREMFEVERSRASPRRSPTSIRRRCAADARVRSSFEIAIHRRRTHASSPELSDWSEVPGDSARTSARRSSSRCGVRAPAPVRSDSCAWTTASASRSTSAAPRARVELVRRRARYSVFRYSMIARRSSSVSTALNSWPSLPCANIQRVEDLAVFHLGGRERRREEDVPREQQVRVEPARICSRERVLLIRLARRAVHVRRHRRDWSRSRPDRGSPRSASRPSRCRSRARGRCRSP